VSEALRAYVKIILCIARAITVTSNNFQVVVDADFVSQLPTTKVVGLRFKLQHPLRVLFD
jgi:hypothetical protein